MDWLVDFQQSLREPVYGFLGTYWPVIAAILLFAVGWGVGTMLPRRGRASGEEADQDALGGDDGD